MVAAQITYAGVAQAVEQQTFNLVVGGSIPPTRTNKADWQNGYCRGLQSRRLLVQFQHQPPQIIEKGGGFQCPLIKDI